MAFKREFIENSLPEVGKTTSPLDNERIVEDFSNSKTSDNLQVNQQYNSDSESATGKISTGAVIPCDMTVKLVRADSANWEIFITALNSFTLTFFGIFLGVWISDAKQNVHNFSFLEKFATIFFLLISLVLIAIWIITKINQSKRGVRIPQDFLNKFVKN
jgi:hypothetical protein